MSRMPQPGRTYVILDRRKLQKHRGALLRQILNIIIKTPMWSCGICAVCVAIVFTLQLLFSARSLHCIVRMPSA